MNKLLLEGNLSMSNDIYDELLSTIKNLRESDSVEIKRGKIFLMIFGQLIRPSATQMAVL